MTLNVHHVPYGHSVDLSSDEFSNPKKCENVFTLENTSFGCQHCAKADRLLGVPSATHVKVFAPAAVPEHVGSFKLQPDELLIYDHNLYCQQPFESSIPLSKFIQSRAQYVSSAKFYYLGDRNSPAYFCFLLYSFPTPSFFADHDEFKEVTKEATRRISSRYSLSQRVADAKAIGILVDSMTSIDLDTMMSLKKLASSRSIRLYHFSIGTMADYKLGNFPEIDLFVSFKCSFCFEWTARYTRPVVTVFEFLAGMFDCFWEYQYGDISSLVLRCGVAKIVAAPLRLIDLPLDKSLSAIYACGSEFIDKDCGSATIQEGTFGTPRTYFKMG